MTDRTAVKAACPLEGGGASQGSTCGVVSGGCLGIVLAHLADILSGEAGKGEDLYGRLREYTSWFEDGYGSTLCRDRSNMNIYDVGSVIEYGVTGKVVTRCMNHIGGATHHLLNLMNRPLEGGGEVTDLDRRLAESGGYCAAEVIRGIREDSGYGSLYLEQLSIALDGGVGLSGGLCGALAGALLPMGLIWGIDPKREGFVGTLIPSLRGHVNLFVESREPELWAVTSELMHEFSDSFGSLECRTIVNRSFESGTELAEFMSGSSVCAEIKDWCRKRAGELITANTVFA